MSTEKKLIYSILNTVKGGEHNNDDVLGERFLRDLLLIYRSDALRKYYKNGIKNIDEVTQEVSLSFNKISSIEHSINIPKLIKLENSSGYYFEKDGLIIPIVKSSEYEFNKTDQFECFKPQAKLIGNKLTFYIGKQNDNLDVNSPYYFLIDNLVEESNTSSVSGDFYGILYNPSDSLNYNWEIDTFPFPAEKIEELKSQILRKEFGIITQAKKDEIQNTRSDNVRYHDNDNITQNN